VHCAAQLGDAPALVAFFSSGDGRASLLAKDDDGWAPLHYAAWYGHLEAVHVLLSVASCTPAAVNVTNGAGATPLHFAAGSGHAAVVAALLAKGADPTLRNEEKQTPAQLAQQLQPAGLGEVLAALNQGASSAQA